MSQPRQTNENRKQRRSKNNVNNQMSIRSSGNLSLKTMYPKAFTRQNEAFNLWNNDKNIVLYGFPGTGKSFLGLYFALKEVMNENQHKVLIVRSAVPSRDSGFLPGNKKQKAEVYEAPYINICAELFERGDAYSILKQKGLIEFETTSYLRGITYDNTIIIIDEFQSMTEHELYTTLSRVGNNSRVIICGDIGQNDLVKEKSGFPTMMRVFHKMKSMGFVEFGIEDIVRSGYCKELIIARESIRNEISTTGVIYTQ